VAVKFYLSFSWGGARVTRANDLDSAIPEAIMAAEATASSVHLLDETLKILGTAAYSRDAYRYTPKG
jgi:hypothetical protein